MDNVGQDLDGGLEFEVVVRVNDFIVNKFEALRWAVGGVVVEAMQDGFWKRSCDQTKLECAAACNVACVL